MKYLFFVLIISFSCSRLLMGQTVASYIKSGDKEMEAKNYYGAALLYRKALDKDEQKADVWNKYAQACFAHRDYHNALNAYKVVATADTAYYRTSLFFDMAQCCKSMGYYHEAVSDYQKYIQYNSADSSYYLVKSKHDLPVCRQLANEKVQADKSIQIAAIGGGINTEYSETAVFSATDTVLYYSAYLPENGQNTYRAAVYKAVGSNNEWHSEGAVGALVNIPGFDVSSIAIHPYGKLMFFAVHNRAASTSKLYYSRKQADGWTAAVEATAPVNERRSSTTHPGFWVSGSDEYLLFASDRRGGKGLFDVWRCRLKADGSVGEAENMQQINSAGNEISPFFSATDSLLFFSSDGYNSMGGFDVFSVEVNKSSTPNRLPAPVNSTYDDFYYTLNPSVTTAYFLSNRIEANTQSTTACCNNIYYYNIPQTIVPDTVPLIVVTDSVPDISLTDTLPRFTLNEFEVYFDNDRPNPRSISRQTKMSYDQTFAQYIAMQSEYEQNFAAGKTDTAQQIARQQIADLFAKIQEGHNNLALFCKAAEYRLQQGDTVRVNISGSASPLNDSRYNLLLSQRRIVSVVNYFGLYNSGVLQPFINSGSFAISLVPQGETMATGVSDSRTDKQNSVYSPQAALLRKVKLQIQSISR